MYPSIYLIQFILLPIVFNTIDFHLCFLVIILMAIACLISVTNSFIKLKFIIRVFCILLSTTYFSNANTFYQHSSLSLKLESSSSFFLLLGHYITANQLQPPRSLLLFRTHSLFSKIYCCHCGPRIIDSTCTICHSFYLVSLLYCGIPQLSLCT